MGTGRVFPELCKPYSGRDKSVKINPSPFLSLLCLGFPKGIDPLVMSQITSTLDTFSSIEEDVLPKAYSILGNSSALLSKDK